LSRLESLSSGYLDKKERDAVKKNLYGGKFKSSLKVFKDHNGFIDGELHTFIGTKGSGKSTWSKTIIADLLYQEKNVFLCISEERKDKYLSVLNEGMIKVVKTDDKLEEIMDKLFVYSEMDSPSTNENELLVFLEDVIREANIDILIFDNFTTSFMSELPINTQSKVLRSFKFLADKCNIPVILFFHTSKLHDSKKLDGDNVRGSGTAINIGSYNYLITQFKDGSLLRNFIYTEKARYHSLSNKKMYEMVYNDTAGMFTNCSEYYIEDYKELINGGKKITKGFS